MIRRTPRSTQSRSSAASDVYKRQGQGEHKDSVLNDHISHYMRDNFTSGGNKVQPKKQGRKCYNEEYFIKVVVFNDCGYQYIDYNDGGSDYQGDKIRQKRFCFPGDIVSLKQITKEKRYCQRFKNKSFKHNQSKIQGTDLVQLNEDNKK